MIPNRKIEFDDNLIGSIECNYGNNGFCDIFKSIDTESPEFIQLEYQPHRILQLNDGKIVISSPYGSLLGVYDCNYNLIRKIDRINNEKVKPWGLTGDSDGNVFVLNDINKTIYKLDCELNYIKSLKPHHNSYFYDIHIHQNSMYVCVPALKRIYVISLDLELISTNELAYAPYHIRIVNETACVFVLEDNYTTCFYRLPHFELISTYNQCGPILPYNNMFYVYEEDGLNLFDQNGLFIEKKKTTYGKIRQNSSDINVINNKLIICLEKKICKLNLKYS